MINKYSTYLFDMDGTLVDSEKLKAKALVETCKKLGGQSHINHYKEVMGQSWEHVATHFWDIANISPEMATFNATFQPIYLELLDNEVQLTPGAHNFVKMVKNKGAKTAVVSSAFSWMVEKILTKLDIKTTFDLVVSKENVENHKPDPEAYLYAIEKLSVHASDVLVFEDSVSGVQAATRADCDTIAIRHDFNTKHDFSQAKKIISDFNELLAD